MVHHRTDRRITTLTIRNEEKPSISPTKAQRRNFSSIGKPPQTQPAKSKHGKITFYRRNFMLFTLFKVKTCTCTPITLTVRRVPSGTRDRQLYQ